MRHETLKALAEGLADATKEHLKRATDPLYTRLNSLEVRLAQLEITQQNAEAKPHVKFCGVWQPGRHYTKGDAATRQGALWIALTDTDAMPGGSESESRAWQLAVKNGGAVTPSRVSFKGCTTRAEAIERFRLWLEITHDDRDRQFVTDALTDPEFDAQGMDVNHGSMPRVFP
jgi:hypothetical protein